MTKSNVASLGALTRFTIVHLLLNPFFLFREGDKAIEACGLHQGDQTLDDYVTIRMLRSRALWEGPTGDERRGYQTRRQNHRTKMTCDEGTDNKGLGLGIDEVQKRTESAKENTLEEARRE